MSETLPIIAICEKCGRGFVYVNPKCRVDVYPPQSSVRGKTRDFKYRERCGGRILPITPMTELSPQYDGDAE